MNSDVSSANPRRCRNVIAVVCVLLGTLFAVPQAMAVDYEVDVRVVVNLEDIRPLIQGCSNLGLLEPLRFRLTSATDLEQLRATIESRGVAEFSGCAPLMRAVYGVQVVR